jgi:hypothetical protein
VSDFTTYVDESGNGGAMFVVGGLTSSPEKWTALAYDWQEVLQTPPAIPYFKFSNAHGLSMTDHGAKIDALIAVINKHVLRGDSSIVDVGEYEVYFRNLIGAGHDNPMLFGYVQTVQQTALHCPDENGRVSFVFDTLDDLQFADLKHSIELFRENCPDASIKARLYGEPQCLDDKVTPPLQAADLWAGAVCASVQGDKAASSFLKKLTIKNRAFLWDSETLPQLLSLSVRRHPDIVSGKYYETKAQRRRRLRGWIMGREN